MSKAEYWDSVAADWQPERRDRLWREHADAVNIGLLERWLPLDSRQRVLKTDLFDEAVAEGLGGFIKGRSGVVIGMDLSHVTAAVALRRGAGHGAAVADVRQLPFVDGSFDCVVSDSTLDHFRSVGELRDSLQELHRVLRPGGTLLVTLDNLANPVVALRNALPFPLLNRLGLVPYYVGASCNPRQLRHLLDQAGFECREMDAILHAPRILAVWAARLLQRTASPRLRQRFLDWLMTLEGLTRLPTRFRTGYFVAARAVRRIP